MKNLFLIIAVMALFSFSIAGYALTPINEPADHSELYQQQGQQDPARGTQQDPQQPTRQQQQQRELQKGDTEEIEVDQLPEAIQNKVQSEHRGAEIESAEREVTQDGEMVYKLKLTTADRGEVTKKFHADGREYQDKDMQRDPQQRDDQRQDRGDQQQRGPQQQTPQRSVQQGDSEEIEVDEVPEVIQNRVQRDYEGAEIESASREVTQDGQTVYKLKLETTDQGEVTKKFHTDGREYRDDQKHMKEGQKDQRHDRGEKPQHGPNVLFDAQQTPQQQQQQQRRLQMGDTEEIEVDQLPEAIQNKVQSEHRGAEIESAERVVTQDGEMVYKLKLTTADKGEVTKKFHADGREYQDKDMQRDPQQRDDQRQDRGDQQQRGPQQQTPQRSVQQGDSEEIEVDQLPEAIQNKLEKDFEGAEIESASREVTTDGQTVYKVKLETTDQGEVTKKFHTDGREYRDDQKHMKEGQKDQRHDRGEKPQHGPNILLDDQQGQQQGQQTPRRTQQQTQRDQRTTQDWAAGEEINEKDLPQAIRHRIKSEFKDADVGTAAYNVAQDGEVIYRVTLETEDQGEVTKNFRSDGTEYQEGQRDMRPGRQDQRLDQRQDRGERPQRGPSMQQQQQQRLGDAQDIEVNQLPEAIRNKVQRDFRGAEIESAQREITKDGLTIYKVTLDTPDRGEVTRMFHTDGREYRADQREQQPRQQDGTRQQRDDKRGIDDQLGELLTGDPEEIGENDLPPAVRHRIQREFRDADVEEAEFNVARDGEVVYKVVLETEDRGEVTKHFLPDGRNFRHDQMDLPREDRQRNDQIRRDQTMEDRDEDSTFGEQIRDFLFGDPDEISENDLPQPIRHRIDSEFGEADFESAQFNLTGDGEVIYRVTMDTPDRGEVIKHFRPDGRDYDDAQQMDMQQDRRRDDQDWQRDRDRDLDRQRDDQRQDRGTQREYGPYPPQGYEGQTGTGQQRGDSQEIEVDQLPETIQNRVQREFRGASIETAEREVTQDGQLIYKVTLDTPDRGEVTKRFHSDGREYQDQQGGMQQDRMHDRGDQMRHQGRDAMRQQDPRHHQQDQRGVGQQVEAFMFGDPEEINENELPQPLRHRLEREFQNADIETAEWEFAPDGEVIYKVTLDTPDRGEVTKKYHSNGREYQDNEQWDMQRQQRDNLQRGGQQQPYDRGTQGTDPNLPQRGTDQRDRMEGDESPMGIPRGQQQTQQEGQRGYERGDAETINVNQLPEAIQNRIQRDHRGSTIESAERRVMPNGEMIYEIQLTTPEKGEETKRYHSDGREYQTN